MVKEINDSSFEELVEKNEGIVLIDFYAQWCGPCKMLSPIIEELSEEMKEKVTFFKIDVDKNPLVTNALKIQFMPTLLIYKQGKLQDKLVGFTPKDQIIEKLQEVL